MVALTSFRITVIALYLSYHFTTKKTHCKFTVSFFYNISAFVTYQVLPLLVESRRSFTVQLNPAIKIQRETGTYYTQIWFFGVVILRMQPKDRRVVLCVAVNNHSGQLIRLTTNFG